MSKIIELLRKWWLNSDQGLRNSIVLHCSIFLLLVFGVPYFDHELNQDLVVSVEIAPISEMTNLQNYAIHDQKKQDPGKSEEIKPQVKTEEAKKDEVKEEKKEQKTEPVEKKEEITFKEKKKEEKKKPEEQKRTEQKEGKKKAEKKSKNELESLLKTLEEESVKNEGKTKKPTKDNRTSDNKSMSNRPYDESMPLSMTEKDAIKSQIERKFSNPVAMSFNPGELVVKIRFTLHADGTVVNATSMPGIFPAQYSNAYHSISEGLIRAAYSASPLQGISRGDEIVLSFDAYYLMN